LRKRPWTAILKAGGMATISTPAVPQVLTWEAFEQLPDHDGMHREVLKGVLQVLPPAKSTHTIIATNAYDMLREPALAASCRAYPEAGYNLSESPATWVQPDVSVLTTARVRSAKSDAYFTGAAELAVEVVSPSESAADIEEKVELMLEAGSQAIWVVYPKTRTVHVFVPGGAAAILSTKDSLSAPSLLPGWSAPVSKLFED